MLTVHFLKDILNEDLFKEYINPVVFINLKFKICAIIKKFIVSTFIFKIYAMIKTVYCSSWLPWTSTRSCYWEVFIGINSNQKTSKLYSSWVHGKNLYRSTIRKQALLWKKHYYQNFADIFVKNRFHLFHDVGLFLYSLRGYKKRSLLWNGLRAI